MHEKLRAGDSLSAVMERSRPLDDQFNIFGEIHLELFDEHMNLKWETHVKNLITSVGDRLYASRGAGLTTSAVPTGMKLGTNSTAVAKSGGGAALGTYLTGSNKGFDSTFPSEAAGVVTYKVTWGAGVATSASPITECVIVTDTITTDATSAAAQTISRGLFSGPAAKGAGDSLVATWTHTILGA